ncbi:MAG: ATP-binding protein [Acetobacteraceae bacterium]
MIPRAHVLVIGNRPVFLSGIRLACERWVGSEIIPTICADPVAAMAHAKTTHFDLVVVDLMPDLPDPVTMARTILDQLPDSVMVLVLSFFDRTLIEDLRAAGAHDVLVDDQAPGSLLALQIQFWLEHCRVARLTRERLALIDANPDAVLVVAATGKVRFVNTAAVALFGRARDDFIGDSLGFSVADNVVTDIEILRDGVVRRAEMRVVSIQWEGQPAFLATLRDVTEQRLQDDQLRQSQKLEAIGRLAAGIAHDFNNILQGLIGNLELVTDALPEGSPARECVEFAVKEAVRGGELTDRLLSFARRQMLWPRRVDLLPVLRDVEAMTVRGTGRQLRIVLSIDPDAAWVFADPTQLETAMLNLVINAADAMPDGGEVRIDTARCTVTDEPDLAPGTYDVIAVSDAGTGMDAETRAHAFEPFFTTKGAAGTGLGLPMVQGFARQSGGDARIISTLGKGTRVEVWLPVRNDLEGESGMLAAQVQPARVVVPGLLSESTSGDA